MYSIEFVDCGQLFVLKSLSSEAFAALLIESSSDVWLDDVIFTNNSGSGLIMLNIGGNSKLTNCSFRNSTTANAVNVSQSVVYTGGLHIEMSTCSLSVLQEVVKACENSTAIQNSTMLISDCEFIDNTATLRKEQGGGLFIEVMGKSTGNHVIIRDCYFSKNSAIRGGGACVRMDENVHGNTIEIINATFTSNLSPSLGGGLVIGYYFNRYRPGNNTVILSGCRFLSNKADIHGGVSIYSSSSSTASITDNSVQFRDCLWTHNSATSLGAALGVVAIYNRNDNNNIVVNQWFIEIVFNNSTFESNFFSEDLGNSRGVRSGIVHIKTVPVKFESSTTFDHNNGTALEVISSSVNFERGSHATFKNNQASPNGAALNLIKSSEITVKNNCDFVFSNNTACSGAAIKQHSTDPYDFIHSRMCFTKYIDDNETEVGQRNINFVFINNTATCKGLGSSLHVTSIKPCNYTYHTKSQVGKCRPNFSKRSIFNCVANFTFISELTNTEITTDAKQIVVTSPDNFVSAFPGKEVILPIYTVDELYNVVPVVYTVLVSSGMITLDRAYQYTTYNKSKFFGKPGNQGTVHVTVKSARNQIEAFLKVYLSQCPPGYVLDEVDEACMCSTLDKQSQRYNCITECNETLNTAILAQNWWINFDEELENKTLDENKLLYGYCPENHCTSSSIRYMVLSNSSIPLLDDQFMCHPTRTGRLCSQCKDNYTAHYHSNTYKCGNRDTCKWGWLLYVVSEILPVTCLFIIIIIFDIKLTNGGINGLIYFAQTIDMVVLSDASNNFATSKIAKIFLDGYALIVRMFNLNFFQLNATSYCLRESAQTLDVIAFRYVTTMYSLVLVILLVVAAHYCNGRKFKGVVCNAKCNGRHRLTARSTLIHGITGFLVLSYSGFTSTSVKLLLSVSLYSIGHKVEGIAVYYNGELTNLSEKHLPYALPAIFVFFTLGLLPPLLLITYPLCYRVLSLFKLSETRFSHILCTCVPLEKIKPLFDSFQSSFKDKYRFFSGLYFVFRLSTLAIQATIPASGDKTYFFAAISIQSTMIFAMYAICRPYKSKKHNIVEGVFLFDITVIAITLSTLKSSIGIVAIQLVLLYLPLLITAAYAGVILWGKIAHYRKETERSSVYYEFNDSMLFNEAENRSK